MIISFILVLLGLITYIYFDKKEKNVEITALYTNQTKFGVIVNRFGTITECCNYLMNNNIVTTKLLKTCRNTLLRNVDKFWNNYYFKLMDA